MALSTCTDTCGIGEKYLYIFVQCAVMFSSHAFRYSYCELSDSRPCVPQAAAAIWTSLRICIRKYGFSPENRDTRRKCRHFFGYPGTHVLFYNRNTRFTAIKLAGSVIPPPPAYAPAGCRSPGRGRSPAHGVTAPTKRPFWMMGLPLIPWTMPPVVSSSWGSVTFSSRSRPSRFMGHSRTIST